MKIKNYLSIMQDSKIMFLKTVKQTARRRRGMWITPCKPTGAARGIRNHRSANQPRSGLSYLLITLLLALLFSCNKKSNLDKALELAGKNRIEIEKVLKHYSKNPDDRLKLKAARFLIENMDTYFFVTSPQLNAYYHTVDSIFSLNNTSDELTEEQEALLTNLKKPNPFYFDSIPDLKYVSAEFLIDNIDRAFEAWKSPFAKDMNFDDFCEFLLPYKVNISDKPDFWRSIYSDTFSPDIKFSLDTCLKLDSGLILHYPLIELDGKGYFSLPDRLFDTVPDFTVSCWITPRENKPWARAFDLGKNNNRYVCFMPYTPDSISGFEITTDAPHIWDRITGDSLPLAKSSHIAITYSNNYISFYINGVSKKRIRTALTNKDLILNYIGKSQHGDSVYFNGEIKDFCIYNRELNYAEIGALAGKTGLPEQRQLLLSVLQTIRYWYNVDIMLDSYFMGGNTPAQLINLKKGSCYDYTVLSAYIFRSLGIPSAIDYVPQWASRSLGHDWNAVRTENGRMEDYSLGAYWDTIGYHLKIQEEKISKIFRQTFAKQQDSPAMQSKRGEDLPRTFRNPNIKDVTDNYLDCVDINISLNQKPPKKSKYAYLSTFNNRDWVPIHWGKIKGGKAEFTKMGKDIVYLPVYYNQGSILPAAEPFILTKEGEIQKIIPDHTKTQTLILKRKYRSGSVPKKGELLLGGRFQVANKPDFSDSLNVYVVNDIPEIMYNTVDLALEKPYRYFRFISLPDSVGGEISEIEIYSTQSGQKLSGKVIGNKNTIEGWEAENVFDGDPLTSYQCVWGETGWVGLDFGKPTIISHFRYLPRNDDNFIKEGEEYELFYWDNYQWNSLGKQTGTSKQYLEYTNAPLNALFWLRNLTKGREERIFTYEDGKQVWW